MNTLRLAIVGTVSAAALVMVACGANTSGGTNTSPSTSASSRGSPGVPSSLDPCSLISLNQAQALLGVPAKAIPINEPAFVGCNYGPSNTAQLESAGTLVVAIYKNVNSANWQAAIQASTHGAGQPLSGLGDAAIAGQIANQTGKSAYVAVLKGSRALVVIRGVTTSTATVPPTDPLISLARQALAGI